MDSKYERIDERKTRQRTGQTFKTWFDKDSLRRLAFVETTNSFNLENVTETMPSTPVMGCLEALRLKTDLDCVKRVTNQNASGTWNIQELSIQLIIQKKVPPRQPAKKSIKISEGIIRWYPKYFFNCTVYKQRQLFFHRSRKENRKFLWLSVLCI